MNEVPILNRKIGRKLFIRNSRGLHARAAARFVKCVEEYDAEILVKRYEIEVSGRSIMGLMMLAAAKGCEIEVKASGKAAERALDAITTLVQNHFGEE